MNDRITKALRLCPLFAGMEPFEIEMTLSGIDYRIVNYNKHDVYALAGMPCKYADIVINGELICRMVSLSGKQVEVSRLREGNIVAPAFIFAKQQHGCKRRNRGRNGRFANVTSHSTALTRPR